MAASRVQNTWLWISVKDLDTELRQLAEEGRDTIPIKKRFAALVKLGDDKLFLEKNQKIARQLLQDAALLPMKKGFAFVEPSDLPSIHKARPSSPKTPVKKLSDAQIKDRIHGAWLGRCIGCLLGKPIEGTPTHDLWGFLKVSKQWPLSDYIHFRVTGEAKKRYPGFLRLASYDTLNYMPIDDDTNYTTTGLLIVEKYGADFTPADVAQFWMQNIPIIETCTAERIAYRNVALHIQPPHSALYCNPYREWIGAQIRADAFGYVNAGNAKRAAGFAWRDASISHVKNGIYGEMLMAAMIAAAPYYDDIKDVISAGLAQIPQKCRLAADIQEAVAWYNAGLSYDEAVDKIHKKWNQLSSHDWTHTNSNAVICIVALLYGNDDFGGSICKAVQPCFDTDCNGATVGSIVGMRIGARKLPQKWTGKINNTLHTALQGNNVLKIDELAQRTFTVWKKMRTA